MKRGHRRLQASAPSKLEASACLGVGAAAGAGASRGWLRANRARHSAAGASPDYGATPDYNFWPPPGRDLQIFQLAARAVGEVLSPAAGTVHAMGATSERQHLEVASRPFCVLTQRRQNEPM